MTTSTAGMSFISPPGTERAFGYDGGYMVDIDSAEGPIYYNIEQNAYFQAIPDKYVENENYINIEDDEKLRLSTQRQPNIDSVN